MSKTTKIKHENGNVTYVMRTGATFVRNHMPLAYAQSLVNRSKNVEKTDKRGQGVELCVDDKYFFPIEKAHETKKKETKETNEVSE